MSAAESPPVSRGLLILLGVVVGLAVLAALWFFVVSPLLDEEPVAGPDPAATPEPAPEPEVTPTPEPTPVPETEEFFTARDPFQQLVRPAAVAPGPGDDTDGDGDTDGDTDGDPDDPAPGVRVGQTSVRLIEVFTDASGVERVRVEVNGTEHTPAEGDTFAERFRVLDITNACATFLFGDNRFTLCEGETIRK